MSFLLCSRGAIECLSAMSDSDPGVALSTKELQMLKAACDTLGQCAMVFTQLNYRAHAAKSNEECTYGLRSVKAKLVQILI